MKQFLKHWGFGLFALAVLIFPSMYVFGGAGTKFNLPQPGTAAPIWSFVCQTTDICSATVLIDNTGAEKGTAANPLFETPTAGPSGGATAYPVFQPTASDNHQVVKNGAGTLYGFTVTNNSATVNYIRFYNAGTGFNGCNSATNAIKQYAIPASTSVGGISVHYTVGIAFSAGISICVTSGYALTDTTAATAGAMSVNIDLN
jgi:hypothetical protein